MAWEDGAWFGSISEAEQKAGGVWVVGNKPHCEDPDFPGKISDRNFLVKLWLAYPDKYAGDEYPMKNRLDDNEWEYVRVMTGRLDCLAQYGGDQFTYQLAYPAEGIDLPPYANRRWKLPDGFLVASGLTVCRRDRGYQAGHGSGYELRFWDMGLQFGSAALDSPVNLPSWQYELIVPFEGACFLLPGHSKPGCHVMAPGYVFLPAQDRNCWIVRPSFQSRGVVVYF